MNEPTTPLRGPTPTSLATKIILFVFAATFVTATAVSGTAIHQSYAQEWERAREQMPKALAAAAAELDRWLEHGRAELRELASRAPAPGSMPATEHFDGLTWLDAAGRTELALGAAPIGTPDPLLAVEKAGGGSLVGLFRRDLLELRLADVSPWIGSSLRLVDASGRVLATSVGSPPMPAHAVALPVDPPARLRHYANAAGLNVLGCSQPLGAAEWSLVMEVPFARVFAPVVSASAWLFVVDLVVVLVFSILAYWITTAWLRPIETLSDTARRIAQGDLDHEIPEPATDDEIGLLTHTFNDMMRRLRRNQTQIEAVNRTLRSRNEILAQLSITDGLTHLHNHRFFQDHLGREIKRVTRLGEPLAMLLVDIDDFKRLNDQLGHAAGDELLAGMARIMSQSVRDSDLLARYGGEEFVVLTPNTDRVGAYQLAEKLRMNIEDASFILDDSMRPLRVTVSIGVAEFEGDRKRFFEAADRALYRAKRAGKNCVVTDEPIPVASPEADGSGEG